MLDLNINSFHSLEHIIYYEWFLDIRGGGPTGYLANLLDGLNRIQNNRNPLVFFDVDVKRPTPPEVRPPRLHGKIRDFFYKHDVTKSFYINHISRYQKSSHDSYVNFLHNYSSMYCRDDLFSKINLERAKTIHVHTAGDAVKVKNSLKCAGRNDVKLLLTCHTPEAPSNEYYQTTLDQGFSKKKAEEIRAGWRQVEKKAFEYSDILVFPSREAMEPLEQTMEGFHDIVSEKDIRFMPTGAKELKPTMTKEEARKKYGVDGKFVIGYVGRHNAVKGYDILQQAAIKAVEQNKDLCFLIGGSQGNSFSPLAQDWWVEAGWVNPADLFQAADVFVLPNRMTYYDLVLLEVMSMGVPIIASSTGGNKSVQADTGSLCLYDNTASGLAGKILSFSKMDKNALDAAGQKAKTAYLENYTTIHFAKRYLNMINQLYADYHFIG